MTRTAFLAALEQLLAPLPEAERKDALSYYEDYLDAAGPENEARAIAELGSPEEVARKILDEQSPQGVFAAPAPAASAPLAQHAPTEEEKLVCRLNAERSGVECEACQ
jgi:uncharacterized membrane protein